MWQFGSAHVRRRRLGAWLSGGVSDLAVHMLMAHRAVSGDPDCEGVRAV
ncbi:hypothetical protein [Kibdelosporangium philippinense]